jgi:hypothetical protein
MRRKNIHSQDPIKSCVVAALKTASGGSKVTCVTALYRGESTAAYPEAYCGRCFKRVGGTCSYVGNFTVTAEEVDARHPACAIVRKSTAP